jgi:hypothetical protein
MPAIKPVVPVLALVLGSAAGAVAVLRSGEPLRIAAPAPAEQPVAVAAPPVAAADADREDGIDVGQFDYVATFGHRAYVLLADAPANGVPGDDVRVIRDRTGVSAIASLADADVPADLRALRGHAFVVDGTCSAKIVGFVLHARATHEFFHGLLGDDPDALLDSGDPHIAGLLDTHCTRGTWARDAGKPSATLASDATASADAIAAATADLRTNASTITGVKARAFRGAGASWLIVTARVDLEDDCPQDYIGALYRDGVQVYVGDAWASEVHAGMPVSLLDVDGDGQPEVMTSDHLWRAATGEVLAERYHHHGHAC